MMTKINLKKQSFKNETNFNRFLGFSREKREKTASYYFC